MTTTPFHPTLAPAVAPKAKKAKGCAAAQATQDLPTLIARQNELLEELIEQQRNAYTLQHLDIIGWISGDLAAQMLGKTISPSGHHLRVLKHCREEGKLTRIGQGSKITYWYEEVRELQRKVANNDEVLP
ncbi:MAG: hypothetical protein AAGA31_08565 [Bacteroidota bacterium]